MKFTDLKLNKVSSELAEKATQTDLITQKGRIDNLLSTPNVSFYEKTTSGTTGALLVVASGATTGQINLTNVTPVATGYTPAANDYVRLVYGVSSGSAELIDMRLDNDGIIHTNAGDVVRSVESAVKNGYKSINLTWVQGYVTNTSSNEDNTYFIKTRDYIKGQENLTISVPDNMRIRYVGYDASYVAQIYTDYMHGDISLDSYSYYKIDLCFSPTNTTTISPTNGLQLKIITKSYLDSKVNNLETLVKHPYKTVYNSNFSSSSDFSVENWTIDTVNRKATPSALGGYVSNVLTNYLKLNKLYEADKRIARFITTLYSDTVLNVHFMRTITTGSEPNESMYSIDIPNLLLKMFANDNRYVTSTVIASTSIPFSIINGNKYIVEVEKDDYTFYLRLIDFKTGEKCELSLQGWSGGTQIQYYALTWGAGATPPIVYNLSVHIMNEPLVCFVGDSITEGYGMTGLTGSDSLPNRFIELLRNDIGNCVISAGSSDTINEVIEKFDSEFSIIKPKILFVTIGTNGGNTLNTLDKYQQLKTLCDNNGIELILNHIPCASNPASFDYVTRNATIDQIGVNGSNFDIATAINNDISQGYNSSYFVDGVHPNYSGSVAMYQRAKMDCIFNI